MKALRIGNRRLGPDIVTKAIRIFAIISWALVLLILFIKNYGKPRLGFSFFGSLSLDKTMMYYANFALGLVFIVCALGFYFNINRKKRKSDKISKSMIFFGLGSIIWLIYNIISG